MTAVVSRIMALSVISSTRLDGSNWLAASIAARFVPVSASASSWAERLTLMLTSGGTRPRVCQ